MTLQPSGEPKQGYKKRFAEAAKMLNDLGAIAINPDKLLTDADVGLRLIDMSDGIYMLNDWTESHGAVQDYQYARGFQRPINSTYFIIFEPCDNDYQYARRLFLTMPKIKHSIEFRRYARRFSNGEYWEEENIKETIAFFENQHKIGFTLKQGAK